MAGIDELRPREGAVEYHMGTIWRRYIYISDVLEGTPHFILSFDAYPHDYGRFAEQANDYNSELGSRYKAMILSEVIMGRPNIMTLSAPRLRQVCFTSHDDRKLHRTNTRRGRKPPRGFDSVVGEPGDDLNYDESIGEYFPLSCLRLTF